MSDAPPPETQSNVISITGRRIETGSLKRMGKRARRFLPHAIRNLHETIAQRIRQSQAILEGLEITLGDDCDERLTDETVKDALEGARELLAQAEKARRELERL